MPQSEDFAEYGIPDLPKLRFIIINVRYSHILKGVSRMLTLRKRKTKRKTKTPNEKAPSHIWPEKKGPWGEAHHPGTHAMPQ